MRLHSFDVTGCDEQAIIDLYNYNVKFAYECEKYINNTFIFINANCYINFANEYITDDKNIQQKRYYDLTPTLRYALEYKMYLNTTILTHYSNNIYSILSNNPHLYVNYLLISMPMSEMQENLIIKSFIEDAIKYTPQLLEQVNINEHNKQLLKSEYTKYKLQK